MPDLSGALATVPQRIANGRLSVSAFTARCPARARSFTAHWFTAPNTEHPCTEHGGLGWTAHIIALHRANAATVRFTEAADDRGLPFSDVQLDLMILIPF